jgi:raffinose/stachyose/melibiose transport system permease protein
MLSKKLQRGGAHSTAILTSLIMVIPVYLIAINALKSSAQASSMGVDLPTAIHLENFSTVIENGQLVTSFFNSMLYASWARSLPRWPPWCCHATGRR